MSVLGMTLNYLMVMRQSWNTLLLPLLSGPFWSGSICLDPIYSIIYYTWNHLTVCKQMSSGLTRDFQGTTMTPPIGCLITLYDPEYVETWRRCFETLAKVKKLRPTKRKGTKWNYWYVPSKSLVRSNPESLNNGLPKKSRRADFQRN